jgi:hypothetical protein
VKKQNGKKPEESLFWRRLDHPGYDSSRLFKLSNGWMLLGMAIFWESEPCHFHYEVVTNRKWETTRARVKGYLGRKAIDVNISAVSHMRWHVNGKLLTNIEGCPDVDLGFTPSTNQIPIRRLSLKIGEFAEAPAAYLQFPEMNFVKLPQTYRRVGRNSYAYQSPTVGYSSVLKVLPSGAVAEYPGIFKLVSKEKQ